jgi:hypothetical protein
VLLFYETGKLKSVYQQGYLFLLYEEFFARVAVQTFGALKANETFSFRARLRYTEEFWGFCVITHP